MREAVQCDTSLLIDAVYLLRMAHELGSEVDAFRSEEIFRCVMYRVRPQVEG